jgi:hypothetical protein
VPIVILGATSKIDELRSLILGRQIFALPKVRPTLTQMIFEKYLSHHTWKKDREGGSDTVFIPNSSEFSIGEISTAGQINYVHPYALGLSLPFELGNYGICQVSAPLIDSAVGRKVTCKIVSANRSPKSSTELPYRFDCLLIDVENNIRKNMANTLVDFLGQHFVKIFKTQKREPSALNLDDISPVAAQPNQTPAGPQPLADLVAPFEDADSEDRALIPKSLIPKSPIKKEDVQKVYLSLRPFLIFMSVTAVAAAIISYITFVVAPKYHKSGKNYTEQLELFRDRP